MVRTDKTKGMIGVIAAEVNSIEQRQIMKGIIRRAQEIGRKVVVFSNLYNPYEYNNDLALENKIYELIFSQDLCGLVLIEESIINETLREIIRGMLEKRQDIPVCAIGIYVEEIAFPNVRFIDSDDARDIEEITEHLLAEHGCRKIDILTGFEGNPASERRVDGYHAALDRHGIAFDPARVHYGDFWVTSGEKLADRYISGEVPLPDAIICASDHMAYGLLDKFLTGGIRVPDDVLVVGYEYIYERIYHSPLLSTYQRARDELGVIAVEVLDSIARGIEPPAFVPPKGIRVPGDSCPCGSNPAQLHTELEAMRIKQQYEKWNVLGTVEQQLTVCSTLEDFIRVLGEHQFLVRWVQNMYLCLCENWYDTGAEKPDEILTCRSVMPWNADQPSITCRKLDFQALYAHAPENAVHYYLPIFFQNHFFGYYVLEYHGPDTYDDIFRNWMKSISNGLEFLCMKNDIRYLLHCQNLSDQHDSLTGFYNQRGFEVTLRARLSESEEPLWGLALRTDVLQDEVSPSMQQKQIDRVLAISEILHDACKQSSILARLDAHTFLIADIPCSSEEDCTFFRQKLFSSIIAQTNLTATDGMETVLCVTAQLPMNSVTDGIGILRDKLDQETEKLMQQKSLPHAAVLFAVRNQLYRDIDLSMADICRQHAFSAGYFRQIYKNCFGVSFHQDAIGARICYAAHLLSDTVMSIASVAEQCGYEDYNYFLRQFQKVTGVTPGQFRRKNG